jgi:hypothetical protein
MPESFSISTSSQTVRVADSEAMIKVRREAEFTKKDFEKALRKVARRAKPSQPDRGSS